MGLDTTTNLSLWQDKVAFELNIAVLHSFQKAGVTLIDQHTASEQFDDHFKNEMKERGGCPSDWVWVVPSQSGSLTPLFHQEMLNYHLSPSFEKQEILWESWMKVHRTETKLSFKTVAKVIRSLVSLRKGLHKKPNIRVVYATETGTAKRYSLLLKRTLMRSFNVEIIGANKFKENLMTGLCIFVVATAGEGAHPAMAEGMVSLLKEKIESQKRDFGQDILCSVSDNSFQ